MVKFDVLVRGRLSESVHGLFLVVPRGHCAVEAHEAVVSLAWRTQEGVAHSVTLSAERFEQHLEAGIILIVDAGQIRHLPAAPAI